jgi:serine/threonine protein kinase
MRVCPICGMTSPLTNRTCPECGTALHTSTGSSAQLKPNVDTVALNDGYQEVTRTSDVLRPGTMLNGRYRVARVLGTGAFGRVYLAEDADEPNHLLAIKELLATEFSSSDEQRDAANWFKREVSTLLTLDHSGIPAIHGYWMANRMAGPMYLAMDYIPGKTLADLQSESDGRLPRQDVVGWGIGLCEVLAYLHSRTPPFVFRDLKPANVMIHADTNRPVLIDFGLARQIVAVGGTAVGTWGYVPFEQVLGRANARSDLYALGAMLHALISGRQPDVEYRRLLRNGNDLEGALRALFPPLEALAPGTPPALAQVVAKATAFDQQDRFGEAEHMADALRGALAAPGGIVMLGPIDAAERAATNAATASIQSRTEEPRSIIAVVGGSGRLDALTPLPDVPVESLPALERLEDSLPAPRPVTAFTPPAGMSSPPTVIADPSAPTAAAKQVGEERRGRWRVRKSKEKAQAESAAVENLIVSAAGEGQFTSISAALRQARPGARIEIRPGVYHEGLLLDRPVEIVGSGAVDEVVIESEDTSCVLMQTDAAIIRNVTIRCKPTSKGGQFYGVNIPTGRLLLEDCQIISQSLACVAIHGAGTSPILRRCLLQNTTERALAVYDHAHGLIEDCEIFSNTLPVRITSHADPIVRRSFIHGGKFGGVGIAEQGRGRFEECDIVENDHHGVSVRHTSNVILIRCRINRNGWNAISVADNSGATVEHCDLTGNRRTTWDVKDSARPQVEMIDNKEA